MTDPSRSELVQRKEAANALALRGVAVLAVSVPIVVLGGALAILLPSQYEAIVATVMLFAMLIAVVSGGVVMIRGGLAASLAERKLRLLEQATALPRARLIATSRAPVASKS